MEMFFIFAAKYLFVLPIVLFGIYFIREPRPMQKRILFFALPSLVLMYLVAKIGSSLYYDPRPFVVGHFPPLVPHVPDNGFPSDHALLVSAVAAIATFFNRKLATALWVLALVVAVARVYVGVHHPIDVIGSILISVVATGCVYLFLKQVWPEKSPRGEEPTPSV